MRIPGDWCIRRVLWGKQRSATLLFPVAAPGLKFMLNNDQNGWHDKSVLRNNFCGGTL